MWSPTWGGRVTWHPEDTKLDPPPGVRSDFWSILARNGAVMEENQDNLVKIARSFDASPAATMGMCQDNYFGAFQGRNGQVGGMVRQPFKFSVRF